ncbi:hypothetical protein [Flavipsychrobacter stenotrophus]|uniref:hypothetical protein n=1 Tax=Flavipsychrobacter stenotrophus TaxID=2077091 RepID=UPI001374BDC5|nr:hypothetical protein [Flavipsychrobacter stenotrophus]
MKRKLMILIAIMVVSMNLTSCLISTPHRGGGTYYQRHSGHHDNGHHYGRGRH